MNIKLFENHTLKIKNLKTYIAECKTDPVLSTKGRGPWNPGRNCTMEPHFAT